MTREELAEAGTAIYGSQWQSALARRLGIAPRTMRRWAAGHWPVPPVAVIAIRALVYGANKHPPASEADRR